MISHREIEHLYRLGRLIWEFPSPQPPTERVDRATGVWVTLKPRNLNVTFYGLTFQRHYDEEEVKWRKGSPLMDAAPFLYALLVRRRIRDCVALLAIHEVIDNCVPQLSNHARLELEADLRALRRQTAT